MGENTGLVGRGRSQCEPQVDLAFTKATTQCRVGEIRPDCHPFSALVRIPATCRELHCRIIRGKREVSAQCDPENKKQKTGWRRGLDSNSWLRFAKCVFRLICGNRESKPENRAESTLRQPVSTFLSRRLLPEIFDLPPQTHEYRLRGVTIAGAEHALIGS